MKKLLTISLIVGIILGFNSTVFAQERPITVGGGLVLSTGALDDAGDEIDNDIGLRVEGFYPIEEKIRLSADFTFFFPKEEGNFEATVLGINFNGNYIFYNEDQFSAYALAGINIAIVSVDFPGGDDSESEVGLNLGAGIEYAVDFGDLFGELRFAGLGGDADQIIFGLGVRFPIN